MLYWVLQTSWVKIHTDGLTSQHKLPHPTARATSQEISFEDGFEANR